ncbi:kelch-like protein 1/4/5 [Clonorchis sinensis]|uniref:Kelch-like protein 1/4/5 n=1 Tax=Clonorchis sinensis TaxID=79923 RepID=G7YJI8_CLOSI|nr:kelch-like protein 1/4/5 [Clonorchis sinensis]
MPQLGYQFHDTLVDGFAFADDWVVCAESQARLKEKLEAAAVEFGRAGERSLQPSTASAQTARRGDACPIEAASKNGNHEELPDSETDAFARARPSPPKHAQKVGQLHQAIYSRLATSAEGYPDQLHPCRQTKECDFLLTNGTQSQKVHRCLARILSRTIDETVDRDPECTEFHVANLSDSAFEALVQYLYTSELTVNSETALELYGAAEILGVDFVAESCLDYLSSRVAVENCVDCLTFAVNRKWIIMRNELVEFCVQNFGELILTESFLRIPPLEFIEILANPGLYVSDELALFNAMRRWCNYDWASREQYAKRLSESIRYQLIQVSSLLDMLTDSDNRLFQEHIRQALIEVGSLAEEGVHSKWDRKRIPIIAVIGGRSQEKKLLRDIICFQINAGGHSATKPSLNVNDTSFPLSLNILSIRSLKNMPCPRKGFGALVFRNNLFVIGGKSSGSMQTVDVYDAENDRWFTGPPLLVGRSWHGVAECNGNIYAFGGCSAAGEALSHCEMLDTRTGAWQAIPQSPHRRMSHGVAGSGTQAFLVGGLGENSVDCFDTVAEKWYAVGNLQEEHEAPGVICHGRHLYVFGGAGKQGSMTCVERYDIDRKHWDSMAAMPVARAFSGAKLFGTICPSSCGEFSIEYYASDKQLPKATPMVPMEIYLGSNFIYDLIGLQATSRTDFNVLSDALFFFAVASLSLSAGNLKNRATPFVGLCPSSR